MFVYFVLLSRILRIHHICGSHLHHSQPHNTHLSRINESHYNVTKRVNENNDYIGEKRKKKNILFDIVRKENRCRRVADCSLNESRKSTDRALANSSFSNSKLGKKKKKEIFKPKKEEKRDFYVHSISKYEVKNYTSMNKRIIKKILIQ